MQSVSTVSKKDGRTPPSSKVSTNGGSGFQTWLIACAALITTVVGRLGEITPILAGVPIVKVLLALCGVTLVLAWKRLEKNAFRESPLARHTLWLGLLILLSVPMSIWPGASLGFLLGPFLILVSVYFIVFKTATSLPVLRNYLTAVTVAAIALSLATLVLQTPGRAFVSTMYDPNDLALVLVLALPMILARAYISTGVFRTILLAATTLVVLAILLTQSRGGLLGLGMMTAYFAISGVDPFLRKKSGSIKVKEKARGPALIVRFVVIAIAGVVMWQFLPSDAKQRFSGMFEADYNVKDRREGRVAVWERGLLAVSKRPIGYGVDAYVAADGQVGGTYKQAHNAFLQLAVEIGLHGSIFFIWLLWKTWRALGRVIQHQSGPSQSLLSADVRVIANGLRASIIAFPVSGFFLSQAYNSLLYVLLALAAAVCIRYGAPSAASAGMSAGMYPAKSR